MSARPARPTLPLGGGCRFVAPEGAGRTRGDVTRREGQQPNPVGGIPTDDKEAAKPYDPRSGAANPILQRCINSPVGVFLLAALFGCGLEVLTGKGLAPLWQAAGWQTQVERLDRWIIDWKVAGEDSLRLAFWVTGSASAVPMWLVAAFGGAVLGRAFRERWLLAASAGGLGLVITNEVLCWEMTWLLISWWGCHAASG